VSSEVKLARVRVRLLTIVALVAISGCSELAPALGPAADAPAYESQVYYPRGRCETGLLEVQVYDRQRQRWTAHPEHSRLRTGSCHSEPMSILANDLRVRCIDPEERRAPSHWVVGGRAAVSSDRRRCSGSGAPASGPGGS
jgi:hypothetical protein